MTTPDSDDRSPAFDRLIPAVYDEVRAVAAAYLSRERPDHTLQPTALVHEAYLKLQRGGVAPEGRIHLLALAAAAMRQILVDHARARAAQKRGGGWQRVTVDSAVAFSQDGIEDVLAVHEALARLATVDARGAHVVEMRFFGGLTEAEIAEELGISERWVREQWTHARAWLRRDLANGPAL